MSEARPELRDVVESLADLPSLPGVVVKLTRLIADSATSASDINEALSSDPGLVAKVLKMVNSPYYGFSRRIATVTNAVVILGFTQIRNLALSAFVFDTFVNVRGSPFDVRDFWRHSIGAAFIGAQIARVRHPRLEEDAFICGLLHDFGKFVMVRNAPGHIAMVRERLSGRGALFRQAERECLDYDHAALGAYVLEKWNLPASLVDAVGHHHDPMASPGSSRLLCSIASLADIVARALLMGSGGDSGIPRLPEEVWSEVDMDWGRMEIVARKAADDYSRSDAFFQ